MHWEVKHSAFTRTHCLRPNTKDQHLVHAGLTLWLDKPPIAWPVCCSTWFDAASYSCERPRWNNASKSTTSHPAPHPRTEKATSCLTNVNYEVPFSIAL